MPPVLAILHPPFATPQELEGYVRARLGDSVSLRFAPYFETSDQRLAKARLNGPIENLRPLFGETPQTVREALAEAELMCAFDLPIDLAAIAPRLRWIQSTGSGIDHLVPAIPKGVRLTTAAGIAAPTIAEFVLGRILQVLKDFRGHDAQQTDKVWKGRVMRTLSGRTMGVVGYGAIGQAVAKRAAAFEVKVLAVRRSPAPDETGVAARVDGPEGLKAMLAESDIVVVAVPGYAENADLIGRAEIAAMKKGAIFCNIARGNLVDEEALLEALRSGHIEAAILDVTQIEPLPADHPFWSMPNVYLSPHWPIAMDTYMARVVEILCDNITREREGRPLRNLIAWEKR